MDYVVSAFAVPDSLDDDGACPPVPLWSQPPAMSPGVRWVGVVEPPSDELGELGVVTVVDEPLSDWATAMPPPTPRTAAAAIAATASCLRCMGTS
jgi:hypothetical protein